MKKILFIILLVALTACSTGASAEVQKNEQTWKDANTSHYRFSLFVSCFCAFRNQMPLTVEVQNGEVVSMKFPDGSTVANDNPNMETFAKYATIDRIFSEIKNSKAEELTVTYDATRGFPTEARFDFIKAAMDDEITIMVADFQALQ